jgi:penicillin amidase
VSALTTPGASPTGLGGGVGARRRRWRQNLLAGAAGIAGLCFLVSLGLSALRERRAEHEAFPIEDGELRVLGIERPVEISRDARGTPHVEAGSESDALFGLGFVHAQDRLAQMVWLVRSARGRAAELVGPRALPADRLARTLGIGELADAQVARLDASTRAALLAYSAGVNAWMAEIRAGRASAPLALERAGVLLEPWTPGDSIAVVKFYAWTLGNSLEASVLYSDLIERLGGFEARFFFPDPPGGDGAAPTQEAQVPPAGPWAGPVPSSSWVPGDPLAFAAGLAGRGAGSSAWVVSGRLSRSGKPILAADAHLDATAPGLFYEAHFRGGALDVAGGTIPGVPVVWSGANRHVAWGATSAGAVTTDLFVESLDPSGTRYHDGDAFGRLRARREQIRVRGGSDEILVVRETRHGPLVNELLPGEHEPLALAWTGARAGDGIGSMLRASRAGNVAQFRAALAGHHEPVLAIVFADGDGAAGLQVAGYVPHRGLATNLAPVPGRTDLYDWKGALPEEALPQATLQGGANWLVASDAPLSRAGVRGEWFWREGNRERRIEGLLREAQRRGPLEVRDLAEMQADVTSPEQRQIVATALALAGDPSQLGAEGREVAQVLSAWDGRTSADSVGAALSHVFVERLVQELLGERLGPELLERYLASPHTSPVYVLAQILEQTRGRGGAAREGAGSDTTVDAIRRSLRESWLFLSVQVGSNREKWGWGRLHTVTFRPLGLGALLGVHGDTLGPFPCDGDENTVAAAEYDHRAPFEVRLASTYRFAVDTGQLDQALSSLVPGESEHPGHPHEADGIARWREGRPRLLGTSRLLIDETSRARLSLEPASRAR